jgi:hypothetical protein
MNTLSRRFDFVSVLGSQTTHRYLFDVSLTIRYVIRSNLQYPTTADMQVQSNNGGNSLTSEPGRHWAELYRQGLLEVDRTKLPRLIEQADAAIRERLLVLGHIEGHDEERQSLLDASRNLDALRRFYCRSSATS